MRVNPLIPPPPSSKRPVATDSGLIDYLSGDTYKSGGFDETSQHSSHVAPVHSNASSGPSLSPTLSSSPQPSSAVNPTSSPLFSGSPVYDEPAPVSKSADQLPAAPWESQPPGSLPPPPSRYNQRQQYFEQQHFPSGTAHSSSGSSSSSYDNLVGQTQNLSLNSSTPTKQVKPEDALFKDLVDFAKAKSSSPSSSRPNRSFWVIRVLGFSMCHSLWTLHSEFCISLWH